MIDPPFGKVHIVLMLIALLVFIIIGINDDKYWRQQKIISEEMPIDMMVKNLRVDHGVISFDGIIKGMFNQFSLINSSTNDFNWLDVSPPFHLKKEAGNDTLVMITNASDTLEFVIRNDSGE